MKNSVDIAGRVRSYCRNCGRLIANSAFGWSHFGGHFRCAVVDLPLDSLLDTKHAEPIPSGVVFIHQEHEI